MLDLRNDGTNGIYSEKLPAQNAVYIDSILLKVRQQFWPGWTEVCLSRTLAPRARTYSELTVYQKIYI